MRRVAGLRLARHPVRRSRPPRPAPFNFGNVSGAFSNGGSAETAQSDLDHLTIPLHTFTFFEHARYKITDNISASMELNYGKSYLGE